jgi:signal transduction histidine kinase
MVGRSVASLFSTTNPPGLASFKVSRSSFYERNLQSVAFALITGIFFYVGTRIGFALTPNGQPNSAFWPPNAILLAALLLAPRKVWWILLVAMVPPHFAAQHQAGVPIWTAVSWFLTNTSEALIGAFCITRLISPRTAFESARGVSVFVLFGVLIAPLATSFLDAAGVVLTGWGRGYLSLGAERFWTNALAELTIVPAIVLCVSNGGRWINHAGFIRYCEAGLLGLSAVLATFLVFGFKPVSPSNTPVLLFVPVALLLWATARFGSGGLSLCLLVISVTAIWYVVHGREPFASASLRQNVLALQILLCTVVLPLMFLSAFMTEARQTQRSLRQMVCNLIKAQEQERAWIGRELHDDISQRLALLAIELGRLRDHPSDVASRVQQIQQKTDEIARDVQSLSHDLHPSKLEYLGVAAGMRSWCNEFAERQSMDIEFETDVSSRIPAEVGVCLFRVLQEALHNAAKHSGVKHIEVRLAERSGAVHLMVRDSGRGFDLEPAMFGKGLGLTSMRERVRLVDGTISIESKPMGGTTIRVSIPLDSVETSQYATG